MISVENLELPPDWIFQQDNDPNHTAKSTKKWLAENNLNILKWPSQFPNLNPIEYLWCHLKIQIHLSAPTNLPDLKTICKKEWNKIPTEICKSLIVNYKKRLIAIEVNNGYSTKDYMKIILFWIVRILFSPIKMDKWDLFQ